MTGEDTPRDDAEYLVPYHQRMKIKSQTEKVLSMSGMGVLGNSGSSPASSEKRLGRDGSPSPAVRFNSLSDVRHRKDRLEVEIQQLNRMAEFQRLRLNGGGDGDRYAPKRSWGIM